MRPMLTVMYRGLVSVVIGVSVESQPEPLGHLERLLQRGFRQSNDEFFSAVTGEYVDSSQSGTAYSGYHLERFVANSMTVSIIDPLEMIEIYHHESQFPAISRCSVKFAFGQAT